MSNYKAQLISLMNAELDEERKQLIAEYLDAAESEEEDYFDTFGSFEELMTDVELFIEMCAD